MALDTSGITSVVNSVSNIILVNPKKDRGIKAQDSDDDAFLFHTKGEEIVTLTSDITDHYVEDNTAINDQVALKPEVFTVNGFIGELNNVTPPALELLKEAADRLATLSPFVPAISSSALRAYNTAFQLYQTVDNAVQSIANTFDSLVFGTSAQTKQQVAFNKFYAWWKRPTMRDGNGNRLTPQLFEVQTPWCILDDMAIQSIRATQDAETRVITDFEITFKKMRFAQTVTTQKPKSVSGRLKAAAGKVTNLGTAAAKPSIGLKEAMG